MAGFRKKDQIDLIRVLRTSDTIKRSDLISGYVNLAQADPGHPSGRSPKIVRSKIDKRLSRSSYNAPRISSIDAASFVASCWVRDHGNMDTLIDLGLIIAEQETVSGVVGNAQVGQVWVTTGTEEDLQELQQLRKEVVALRAENDRLRFVEKKWLKYEDASRLKGRRISEATKNKKKTY